MATLASRIPDADKLLKMPVEDPAKHILRPYMTVPDAAHRDKRRTPRLARGAPGGRGVGIRLPK